MPGPVAVVRYIDAAEHAIASGPEMRATMQRVVDDIAAAARPGAPKDTGRGARSIAGTVRRVPTGWQGRVSWDRRNYYMYMQHEGWNTGKRRKPGRPFLREAAQQRRDIR